MIRKWVINAVLGMAVAGLIADYLWHDAAALGEYYAYSNSLRSVVLRIRTELSAEGIVSGSTQHRLQEHLCRFENPWEPAGSYQQAAELLRALSGSQSVALNEPQAERIDQECLTILSYIAVRQGNAKELRRLLAWGVDVECREADTRIYARVHPGMYLNRESHSLLQEAAAWGRCDVARVLIEAGADLEACQIGIFRTALHNAAANGHAAVVRLLVDAGANIWATNTAGLTPLDEAIGEGHWEVVDILQKAAGTNS